MNSAQPAILDAASTSDQSAQLDSSKVLRNIKMKASSLVSSLTSTPSPSTIPISCPLNKLQDSKTTDSYGSDCKHVKHVTEIDRVYCSLIELEDGLLTHRAQLEQAAEDRGLS